MSPIRYLLNLWELHRARNARERVEKWQHRGWLWE